jgi:putative phage-type endonuclease
MITASEASSCLFRSKKHCEPYVNEFGLVNFKYKNTDPLNPYETREDYILKKASSFYGEYSYKDTVYTMWGKKYEDAASRLYCKLYNVKLHEFGLVPHAKIKWLAASPDGITEDGIMLEIKCPKSRKIDTTSIPLYYWIQVQIQLEVCNLEHCDFIECELEEFKDEIEALIKKLGLDNYEKSLPSSPAHHRDAFNNTMVSKRSIGKAFNVHRLAAYFANYNIELSKSIKINGLKKDSFNEDGFLPSYTSQAI